MRRFGAERFVVIVISLINEKGGVGKTTVAENLAAGLAIRGQRVLFIDADAQANATISLKLEPQPGLYDLLVREASWDDLLRYPKRELWAGEHAPQGMLALLPSNVETRLIADATDRLTVLHERLLEIEDQVDVVVIDTSPTPSMTHAAIYLASDAMLMPTQLANLSIVGIAKSLLRRKEYSMIREGYRLSSINVLGILPMMTQRTRECRECRELLVGKFGGAVWDDLPRDTLWEQASRRTRTIFAYAPESKAAGLMWKVVDKVLAYA